MQTVLTILSTIAIMANTLSSEAKPVEMTELTERIKTWTTSSPDRPILVEADQDANYGRIVFVLDAIRNAGAVNIGLATRPETK